MRHCCVVIIRGSSADKYRDSLRSAFPDDSLALHLVATELARQLDDETAEDVETLKETISQSKSLLRATAVVSDGRTDSDNSGAKRLTGAINRLPFSSISEHRDCFDENGVSGIRWKLPNRTLSRWFIRAVTTLSVSSLTPDRYLATSLAHSLKPNRYFFTASSLFDDVTATDDDDDDDDVGNDAG